MDLINLDIDRFCRVVLYSVESGVLTGEEAIELIKLYYAKVVK